MPLGAEMHATPLPWGAEPPKTVRKYPEVHEPPNPFLPQKHVVTKRVASPTRYFPTPVMMSTVREFTESVKQAPQPYMVNDPSVPLWVT